MRPYMILVSYRRNPIFIDGMFWVVANPSWHRLLGGSAVDSSALGESSSVDPRAWGASVQSFAGCFRSIPLLFGKRAIILLSQVRFLHRNNFPICICQLAPEMVNGSWVSERDSC